MISKKIIEFGLNLWLQLLQNPNNKHKEICKLGLEHTSKVKNPCVEFKLEVVATPNNMTVFFFIIPYCLRPKNISAKTTYFKNNDKMR